MSAFGPKGESIGIVSDETVVPLRIHCEIFGPSVHYKSVGVKACTTVQEVISSLLQKMDRLGGEENVDLRSNEFCMAEVIFMAFVFTIKTQLLDVYLFVCLFVCLFVFVSILVKHRPIPGFKLDSQIIQYIK